MVGGREGYEDIKIILRKRIGEFMFGRIFILGRGVGGICIYYFYGEFWRFGKFFLIIMFL